MKRWMDVMVWSNMRMKGSIRCRQAGYAMDTGINTEAETHIPDRPDDPPRQLSCGPDSSQAG